MEELLEAIERYREVFGTKPPRWSNPDSDEEFIKKINLAIKNKNRIVEEYTREDIY